MIVLIAVVTIAMIMVTTVFCSSCYSSNSNSNLARAICGKLIGIGSVNSLDDIHHIIVITLGETELALVHKYNVGMYSINSHTLHDIFCPTLPWQRGP